MSSHLRWIFRDVFVLGIFIGAAFCHNSQTLRDQFHASCFPGCRCNSTVIECRDLGETTTELFRHIQPEIYPNLDTLIVTGNQFGDLPNENIFGNNFRHSRLNLVNISNNGIRSFGAQTFVGIPRVEYFYVDGNSLNDVVDDRPFSYLRSLKLLSMNRVFGDHISIKARTEIIRKILNSNQSFIDLKEVLLEDNRINDLHPETFCKLEGLTMLYLTNNELKAFNFKLNCLTNLHMLDLAGNHLTTIPINLWKSLPSLDTIDVSRNPFVCDCQLQAFHKLAVEEMNIFLNQETTTCAKPAALMGKKLFNFQDDTNLCRFGGGRQSIFGQWFLLLLAGAGILLAYRFCREHSNFIKNFDLKRSTSKLTLPLIPEGYSQLKSTDDGIPPPAFV